MSISSRYFVIVVVVVLVVVVVVVVVVVLVVVVVVLVVAVVVVVIVIVTGVTGVVVVIVVSLSPTSSRPWKHVAIYSFRRGRAGVTTAPIGLDQLRARNSTPERLNLPLYFYQGLSGSTRSFAG